VQFSAVKHTPPLQTLHMDPPPLEAQGRPRIRTTMKALGLIFPFFLHTVNAPFVPPPSFRPNRSHYTHCNPDYA